MNQRVVLIDKDGYVCLIKFLDLFASLRPTMNCDIYTCLVLFKFNNNLALIFIVCGYLVVDIVPAACIA